MFNGILNININYVIGFCEMDGDLILTEDDQSLINKFCQLFALIKKKADILSAVVKSSPVSSLSGLLFVCEIWGHMEKFKKDAKIGKFARDFLRLFDS